MLLKIGQGVLERLQKKGRWLAEWQNKGTEKTVEMEEGAL